MGVETLYPMHRRNYPLLSHVKLNEPLMGTETLFCCWSAINYKLIHFVKLNNPLVGTETSFRFNDVIYFKWIFVKLNAPPMGTEIILIIF